MNLGFCIYHQEKVDLYSNILRYIPMNFSPVHIKVCALPHATCVTFSGFRTKTHWILVKIRSSILLNERFLQETLTFNDYKFST